MVAMMVWIRGNKLGGFVGLVAWGRQILSTNARTQRVEDEVRFELLKGLAH